MDLVELMTLLKSSKKKDRSIGFQNVKLLLGKERVQSHLASNTGVDWNDLFSAVHAAVKIEATTGKAKPLNDIGVVVTLVVDKARGFLNAGALAAAILEVLESTELSAVVGRCYFELANAHLLDISSYRSQLTPDIWNKLANICVVRYQNTGNGSVRLEKYLELLWKTVKWGLHAIDLLDLLPFLKDALEGSRVPSAQQHLLLVVNTCLVAVAADARYQVAHFVEAVIPFVAQLHGAGRDSNYLIFQLFAIAVNVHHPHGVNEDDELAYADNWTVWKDEINQMLKVCEAEIVHAYRVGHDTPLPSNFMELIVDLNYIVKGDNWVVPHTSDDDRSSSPRPLLGSARKRPSTEVFTLTQTQKRPKVLCLTSSIIDNLRNADATDRWLWLQYLEVLIERHPDAVDEKYPDIVFIVTHMLCEVRRPEALAPLSRAAVKLLDRLPLHILSPEIRKTLLSAWEKSFDSLVRSVVNSHLPDLFLVIQGIVRNVNVNWELLVDNFLNGAIPASPKSIDTMIELIGAGAIKTESQRCSLAKWASQCHECPDVRASLILALGIVQFTSAAPLDASYNNTQLDFQDSYYMVTLKKVTPYINKSINKVVKAEPLRNTFCSVLDSILEDFQSQYEYLLEMLADTSLNRNLIVECTNFIQFLLIIVSGIWNYEANNLKTELLMMIKKLLFSLTSAASTHWNNSNTGLTLESLIFLYSHELHPELRLTLRTSPYISSPLLQTLLTHIDKNWFFQISRESNIGFLADEHKFKCLSPFDKLRQRNSNTEFARMFGRKKFERLNDGHLVLLAAELLTQYLAVPGSAEPVHDHKQIVHSLIDIMSEAVKHKYKSTILHPQLMLRIICSLCCSRLDPDQFADCIGLLLEICSAQHADTVMHTALLTVLEDCLPRYATKLNDRAIEDLVSLMTGFRRVLKKNKQFPLEMALSFVRILITICSLASLSSKTWNSSSDPIVADITWYLNHPCVYVRAAAAQGIASLIQVKPTDKLWHRTVMDWVTNRMPQSSAEQGYAKIAHTGTSLLSLANAMAFSGQRRLSIANNIIQFVKDNDCSIDVIKNLINYLSSIMNIDDSSKYFSKHFKDICVSWLQGDRAIQEFPYQLLGMTSLRQFYSNFMPIISAVCFLLKKLDVLSQVASTVDLTLVKALETGYPIINARASSSSLNEIEQYIPYQRVQELQESRFEEFIYAVISGSEVLSGEYLQKTFQSLHVLQKLLLLLEEDIVESVTAEDRVLAFIRYKTLVESYFSNDKFTKNTDSSCQSENGNTYVFRDAVSVFLRVIQNDCSEELAVTSCGFIQNVFEDCLSTDNFKLDASFILPDLVNALVSVSSNRGDGSEAFYQLLRFLMIDCREFLYDAIVLLDPFPNEPQYADFFVHSTLDLHQELQRTAAGYKRHRVGGLTRLLKALETQKGDLVVMLRAANTVKGKNYIGKMLQEAVHQLLELCAHRDQAVREEAAKCLGEIGPADLGVMITSSETATIYQDVEIRLVDSLMAHLKVLIETEPLEVKKAASATLYAVISCPSLESQCSSFYAPFLHESLGRLRIQAKTDTSPPMSVWMTGTKTSHEVWVQNLTITLLEMVEDNVGIIELLIKLCHLHLPSAHYLLPFALEIVLTMGSSSLQTAIISSINTLQHTFLHGESSISMKSMSSIVNALDSIRCYKFLKKEYGCFPGLNKLHMAEVAAKCGAHYVSMMYAELWYEDQKNTSYKRDASVWTLGIDDLGEDGMVLSRIMRASFVNVGVIDGLQGCGWSYLAHQPHLIAHLEQIGRWDLALIGHDATSNPDGIVRSLRHKGLLTTVTHIPNINQDLQMECASLLGDWGVLFPTDSPASFQLLRYSALKAIHDQDIPSAIVKIDNATNWVLDQFNNKAISASKDLYRSLTQLQCLKQLRDITDAKSENAVSVLACKWSQQDQIEPAEFSLLEEILATRCAAISEIIRIDDTAKWKDELGKLYLRFSKLARKATRNDVALRNSVKIKQMKEVHPSLLNAAKVEESRYYWAQGEHKTAIFLLNRLILQSLEDNDDVEMHSKCLRIYGNWMVKTKAENPLKIKSYFMKSISLSSDDVNLLKTYASLAKFADSNYVQRKEYRESAEYLFRQENIQMRKNAYIQGRQTAQDNEKLFALTSGVKEANMDEVELKSLDEELKMFLHNAVRYYSLSLELGEKYDHFVFRLVSLWLNCPPWASEVVVDELKNLLPRIPSYKFITLLPQIAPRMHEHQLLQTIVERALLEHPHQTLPIVMAIRNAQMDLMHVPAEALGPTPLKIKCADMVLSRAMKASATSTMLKEMSQFCIDMVRLANLQSATRTPGTITNVPADIFSRMKNFNNVLMPTIILGPQPNRQYNDVVGISGCSVNFEFVGGINAPKKMDLMGTDGIKRSILVKGKDDPHLDAVIQQVFRVANEVLARDETTSRRQLQMRTYKVTPLSQRSGIIQWCDNTQPIGQYLAGRNGAHVRFRPQDIKPQEARAHMQKLAEFTAELKLSEFLEICKRIKPVFHYFFLEKFPSAAMAFEKRLAYTRSVATSSMIGYVMGLGDRHVQNILIDNLSGEVIHIDFGIAFEHGKTLKTPETVPFRLTRDIVDGMGVCGVDGVFRTSCQQTLAVLREHKDVMLTLLEVLLYDPHYLWAMQNHVASDKSSMSSEENSEPSVNAVAARALQRVTSKMLGMEGGGLATTVEGQVNGLLQKAQDPANLSRLYAGWQPYL